MAKPQTLALTHRAGARVAGEPHDQAAGVGGPGADDHHGAVALFVLEVRLVQEGRQLLQRQRLRLQEFATCCFCVSVLLV